MTSRSLTFQRMKASAIAVAAASVLVLTACGNSAQPSAEGSSSASASATASATPSPTPTPTPVYKPADATGKAQNVPVPVLPEAAKAETKEGLEAFAKHWFALLAYAYETGDTAPLAALSDPGCVFCSGLQKGISTAWQDNRWIVGGQIETPSISAKIQPGSASHHVTTQVIQKQVEIYKADGTLYQEPTKASNAASQMTATFSQNGWKVTDLGLIR